MAPSHSPDGSTTDRTVDLSHTLESGMPVYPGTDPAVVEPTSTVERDGYRTTRVDVDSHTGTHVDAPAHMLADGPTLEAYRLETFRFDARVLDCRPLEARDAIDVQLLREAVADAAAGGLEDADLLVVRTGWEAHWETGRYVDHPYLTDAAAEWIVANECHLGLDSLNPDPTPSERATGAEPEGYPAHRRLFSAKRLILENLCGLEAVPDRFELHAVPLAIGNADGSPVRAVAVLE